MSDNLSKKIVTDTFENSFSKERFTLFIKNLLNHVDDSSEGAKFVYQGQYIPEVYRDSISSLERIGKYTDPEGKKIGILIVNLKKENSLDRARTLQRNFVAWYLDGSRGGILKDAALVAFVSPDLNSWRFSLVKMDYKIQEAKVKKDLTPAKRYSFLVGSQEKSHTAQSRLVPIIEDDVNDPTLKQLEEAFNIEKVTKEFFEKYRELFIRLKESLDEIISKNKKIRDDFEKKNIDTTSFAKKLLGQIVFLYFLQKKGWFGVERDSDWGTGPKNFLRELFDKKKVKYKNFFNDVLEPLFYEALAKKRDEDFYNYLNCKIPFLNGGLFDPINDYDWVYTDININNDLFSNEFKTKEGDIGTGILDVFDRYNFTVREDEPLEKEVAVDPEMLGKVFENLLEVKDRKSKGTYYTPREIVHYMCQESLINYLHSELTELGHDIPKEDLSVLVKKGASFIHNDQSASSGVKKYEEQIPKSIKRLAPLIDLKLTDIKVCDPAVGSGAFLVGMMNEIVSCREVLWSLQNDTRERDTYKFKRDAIQHSLYGVDIDPSAVEVAKLRLWLSLVVEEDDIKKIKPLPNLDYKIMQGNSLLEEFKGVKLFDEKLLTKSKVVEYDYIAELKQKELELSGKLLPYYQKNSNWMKNRTIPRPSELAEIEMEMDRIKASLKKNNSKAKELVIRPLQVGLNFLGNMGKEDIWLKLKKLYSVYFKSYNIDKKKRIRSSIEKVIWELIETTLKEEGKLDTLKEIEVYKNNGIRPFFLWKLYFADVFQEKGGFDVVIANPPYLEFDEMRLKEVNFIYYRDVIGMKYKFNLYTLFLKVCPKLLKNNGILSFIVPNSFSKEKYNQDIREDYIKNKRILFFVDFTEEKEPVFENASNDSYIVFGIEKNNLRTKIKIDKYLNKDFIFSHYISQEDLLTSFDYQFNISKNLALVRKIEKNSIPLGRICFIRVGLTPSKKYKATYGSDYENFSHKYKDEKKLYRFLHTNKNANSCDRYNLRHEGEYIIWDRDSLYKDKVCPGEFEDYYSEKLIFRNRGVNIVGSYDDRHIFVNDIFNIVVLKASYRKDRINEFTLSDIELSKKFSLKFILSLINSKLLFFFLINKFVYRDIKTPMMKLFPIANTDIELQQQIINIVDKILAITKSDDYIESIEKQAKVKDYEKQIDQMVYKLYGLTKEEIKIVESQAKS